jgi:uncharacterized protein YecE (DUF72 family)
MQYFVGTSGYSYKEWKGKFYPADLSTAKMLLFYAQHFSTVESNGTFYRMPTADQLKAQAAQTPDTFRFALKAPQILTHFKRLKNVGKEMGQFVKAASALKSQLGPILFQLSPNFKKDLPRLEKFLTLKRGPLRLAFEFRHPSWLDEETFACLREQNCALCVADTEDGPPARLEATSDWGYVRLRRNQYSTKQLADWVKELEGTKWKEAHVYFMHEETGTGPVFAQQFLKLAHK